MGRFEAKRAARLALVGADRPAPPNQAEDLRETFTQEAKDQYQYATENRVFGSDAKMQRAREELSTGDSAGHVMLLHDIEIGGFYVSCTVSNYGQLMYHHSLPVKEFMDNVKSVVVATDLTN